MDGDFEKELHLSIGSCADADKNDQAIISKVIKTITKCYGLKYVRDLGQGTFGKVVEVTNESIRLAIKITLKPRVGEVSLWPKIQHRYVLAVQDTVAFDNGIHAFFMPIAKSTLQNVVSSSTFQLMSCSFDLIRIWIKQFMTGLAYLHKKNLFHLDLKANNILISYKNIAQICDFTFLTYHASPKATSIGLPNVMKPPEILNSFDKSAEFSSEKVDLWSAGIVTLESLCGLFLSNKYCCLRKMNNAMSNKEIWDVIVQPFVRKTTSDPKFLFRKMMESYPNSRICRGDACDAKLFMEEILNENYALRTSCASMLCHTFIKNTVDRQDLEKIVADEISNSDSLLDSAIFTGANLDEELLSSVSSSFLMGHDLCGANISEDSFHLFDRTKMHSKNSRKPSNSNKNNEVDMKFPFQSCSTLVNVSISEDSDVSKINLFGDPSSRIPSTVSVDTYVIGCNQLTNIEERDGRRCPPLQTSSSNNSKGLKNGRSKNQFSGFMSNLFTLKWLRKKMKKRKNGLKRKNATEDLTSQTR